VKSIVDHLRDLGLSPDAIARATMGGKPLSESAHRKQSDGWPGFRSKWEALYAAELDAQKAAGEIVDWVYEGVTLRLTEAVVVEGKRRPAVRYKADFAVWLPTGRLRLIEIKGFARQKDLLRYKMARDKYRQVEFLMIGRKQGAWKVIL
jgi:hypothetical protein